MSDRMVNVPLKKLAADKGLAGGPFGSTLGAKDYIDSGVPVIRGQNLSSDGYFSSTDFVFVSEKKVDNELHRNLALPGDVVFTQRGTLGQVGIVPHGLYPRYVISQSQMRMRVNRDIADTRYVYYCFKDPSMLGKIESHAIATGVPHINLGILSELEVPCLPLRVQRAIGEVLGALDDKIAVNERTAACALELARTQYEWLLTSSLPAKRSVGELAEIFDGPHATPTKTATGPWFLSITSLRDGVLELGESAHVAEEDFARWTRRVTPTVGDVLFSYETRLGSAALMPPGVRACLGRRMAVMRPREGTIGPATLLHAYLAREFQDQVQQKAVHGATVDRIPLTELPSWEITIPAKEELAGAERLLSPLHRTISARQQENRKLAELRDTLLPKLMSGELRIKDAERQVEEAT